MPRPAPRFPLPATAAALVAVAVTAPACSDDDPACGEGFRLAGGTCVPGDDADIA